MLSHGTFKRKIIFQNLLLLQGKQLLGTFVSNWKKFVKVANSFYTITKGRMPNSRKLMTHLLSTIDYFYSRHSFSVCNANSYILIYLVALLAKLITYLMIFLKYLTIFFKIWYLFYFFNYIKFFFIYKSFRLNQINEWLIFNDKKKTLTITILSNKKILYNARRTVITNTSVNYFKNLTLLRN